MTLALFARKSPVARMLAVLRRYGSNAHLYLPGVGVINGVTAGNYLDSTGTTPASVDSLVGLVIDALTASANELIADPDINTGSANWTTYTAGAGTVVFGAGIATLNSISGIDSAILRPTIAAVTAGKTYKARVVASGVTGTPGISVNGETINSGTLINGVNEFVFTYTSGNPVVIKRIGNPSSVVIESFSLREVPGIHATQATTGIKPTLRRGLVNLLTYSNDLTNAAWTPSNGTPSAVSATLPDGGTGKINRFTPAATNTIHRSQHGSQANTSGAPYTFAFIAKADGYRYVYANGCVSPNVGQVTFDLLAGVVSATNTGAGSVAQLSNGWVLCVVNAVSSVGSAAPYLQVNDTPVATDRTFTADGTSGVLFISAGTFAGTLTAAQILAQGGIPLTTTAAVSASSGAYHFDGLGAQLLQLGSLPFAAADDHYICALARCDNDAGTWAIFSAASTASATPLIELDFNTGYPRALYRDDASTLVTMQHTSKVVGLPVCLAMHNNAGARALRVNGALSGSSITALGTCSLTSAALLARATATPSNQLPGGLYGFIAIKGSVSNADALLIERGLNALSGYAAGRF